MHAEKSEAFPNKNSIKRFEQHIKLLNKQEFQIKQEIEQEKDSGIKDKISQITTIPGVGNLTATVVLAETNGFELIKN